MEQFDKISGSPFGSYDFYGRPWMLQGLGGMLHALKLRMVGGLSSRIFLVFSQKLHNMPIWLRIVSISSIHDLFHKQVHGRCVL